VLEALCVIAMLCLVRMADVTLVLQVARISDEQRKYKVVQVWPGQTVTCLHTNSPGHIWTTLYMRVFLFAINVFWFDGLCSLIVICILYYPKHFSSEFSGSFHNCQPVASYYTQVRRKVGMTAPCVLRQPGQLRVAGWGYHVVIRTNIPISRIGMARPVDRSRGGGT
jgi:hypothetical protein